MRTAPGDPLLNTVLDGKYRLVEMIGSGAMGRVYKAQHMQLEAPVAVKVLSPELTGDPQTIRRFHHEARAASRLRHENVIRIHDFGQADNGMLYLVMELLSGHTLGEINRREGPLLPERIVRLLGPALLALDEAHHADVIHRDFKPENIFVEALRSGAEHVKVLDFGIAKVQGMRDSSITSSGSVCGTPDYMSPEQIRGDALDARSDVYAAGVVLYELLTGTRPYEGSLLDVLTRHLSQPPEAPRHRRPDLQIFPPLEQICLRAMSKRREERYGSAREMMRALEGALQVGQACPSCHEVVAGGVRFCPWCGAAVGMSGVNAGERKVQPAARAPAGAELPRWSEHFLEREEVLRRLAALDHEALLLLGPSGIGKTRVVEQWLARLSGARPVVLVYPDETGARAPLRPIRLALALALGISERPSLLELDLALGQGPSKPAAGGALDRPGLAELFGVWEATVNAPYDVRKRECFAAALQTFRRLPVLFVFEDVDHYDLPSRALLQRLCQDPGEATVLLTAAADPAEPPGDASAGGATLVLSPLSKQAVAGLGLPETVAAPGHGVPGALEQAYRALAEGAAGPTLAERVEVLPKDARRMLEALAVAGTQTTVGILAELCQQEDPRPALHELTLRSFLRVYGEQVLLPSAAQREQIYAGIQPERRRQMHRACLQLFEERGAGPTVLAHHAVLGSEKEAPLHLLQRAGDAARNSFDDEGAERWFRHALARARTLVERKEADKDLLVQAGLRLALTLRYAGKIIDAEQMLRETLSLGPGDARAEADARRGLARLAYAWDQPAAARQELHAAIKAGWRTGDPGLLVELYLELGEVLVRAGDPEGATQELQEGLDTVTCGDGIDAQQGPAELWRLLWRLGELHLGGGRLREALEIGKHALRWASRAQTPVARIKVQHLLGKVHAALEEPQVARRYHEAALEEARLTGDRRSTAELLIVMAQAMQAAEPTAKSRGSARILLEEASSLSQQIGWVEGLKLVEQELDQLD